MFLILYLFVKLSVTKTYHRWLLNHYSHKKTTIKNQVNLITFIAVAIIHIFFKDTQQPTLFIISCYIT